MARRVLINGTISKGFNRGLREGETPRARRLRHINWIAHRRKYISTSSRPRELTTEWAKTLAT